MCGYGETERPGGFSTCQMGCENGLIGIVNAHLQSLANLKALAQ